MFYGFDIYYLVLVLPAVLISLYAQYHVKTTFSKYSAQYNRRGLTGGGAAQAILDQENLRSVRIERVSGSLTDHYDPRANIVRLSDTVYSVNSIAAVGVAAHEVGHALQHNKGYLPIKLRNAVLPIAQIGSTAAIPLAILGFVLSWGPLIQFGILLYAAVVLFQIVTLPVEFNASSRALGILSSRHLLEEDELLQAKKVLQAAAMTYVASTLTGLANLLRLVLLSRNRRR